jgi:hypothetical protein
MGLMDGDGDGGGKMAGIIVIGFYVASAGIP